MDGSQAYTLRETARTFIWIYTGENTAGNVRILIANHVRVF